MRMNRVSTLSLAAMTAALSAPPCLAGVTYDGWVNGFGYSRLTYTITCRNGQVISARNSSVSSGSAACDDGSNTFTWEFNAFWRADLRVNDRKAVVSNSRATTGALLLDDGQTMLTSGGYNCDGPYQMEVAILAMPGELIPKGEAPRSLDDLIAAGHVSPDQVVHRWEFFGPGSEPFDGLWSLPGILSEERVILYFFGRSIDCAADFDGDGFVTGIDYDLFVTAFENGDMSADFDGDGFLTGIDFDRYVLAFEEGCE